MLIFFVGVTLGTLLMGLMAASRESEPHEVHVYCDEDGIAQIMTFPVKDKVVWHRKEKDIQRTIGEDLVIERKLENYNNLLKSGILEQRWIPVSERLPEERDWYLAVFKESDTGFQLIPRVADYIGMGENKWKLKDSLSSEYLDLLECIAWMPLPEPYKAESEEV